MANAAGAAAPVKATARYVRVAPNKARQVIAHIRGLGVEEAQAILQLSPKGVAEQVLKTLNSAIANAEHNNNLDPDHLVVTEAYVDEGPMLKRFQPRAMGRAYRIRKRTSHITIAVAEQAAAPLPQTKPSQSKPSRGKPSQAKPSQGKGKAAKNSVDKTEKE